jgi:hypothetical protein
MEFTSYENIFKCESNNAKFVWYNLQILILNVG